MGSFDSGIEYCNEEWNPVTGCLHWKTGECAVGRDCWARTFAEGRLKGRFGYDKGFEPTLHEDKLQRPYRWKRYRIVCTCFMGDLFGDFIPAEWIEKVLNVIRENEQHVFLLLTKNPKRYKEFDIPENAWCGVSINRKADVEKRLPHLLDVPNRKWLSLEPLLEDVHKELFFVIAEKKVDWVIVGAKTGKRPRIPPRSWVEPIIDMCQNHGVPVFLKDNLTNFSLLERAKYQQFPEHDIRSKI